MHQSLLSWNSYRYLRWTLVLIIVALGIYVSQYASYVPPHGGTWQGYVLGITGALGIVWLALLGIRKRRYSSRLGTLAGWASAHVYLGILVLTLSVLHSAFELESFNVHTATFWLMLVVVLSGFYGLYAYLHLPEQRSTNLAGEQPEHWLNALKDIDARIWERGSRLRLGVAAEVMSALRGTVLGGSGTDQLLGRDRSYMLLLDDHRQVPNTDQKTIITRLSETLPDSPTEADQALILSELFSLFGQRQLLLKRLRRDRRYAAWLRVWLYLHIPCTFALLIGLLVHVFTIIYYW